MWSAPEPSKGPAEQLTEIKDLVVAYAKQETIDPLKTLGRYLGYGIAGALVIGTGLVFALLALLRGLQQLDVFNPTPTDGGDGRFSWAPYGITFAVGVLIVGLFLRSLYRMTQQRERR
jgi:hypothetical protein